MKKIPKIFFALILQFIVSFSLNAQNDSISFEKNQFVINAGIGQSEIFQMIEIATGNPHAGNNFYNFYYTSPAYNTSCDFGISKKEAIGLAITYQWLDAIPVNAEDIKEWNRGTNIYYGNQNETVSRLNIAYRYLHSIGNNHNKYIRGYWGMSLGTSFWKDELPDNPTYNALVAQYNAVPNTQLAHKNEVYLSLQYFMGLRIFVTRNIGFHLEAAFGAPYFFESGISYRFNAIKKRVPKK